jgi:hypothetical protein
MVPLPKSRRSRLLVCLALLTLAALVVGSLVWPTGRANKANFARVRLGMSVKEVTTLLGPVDYGTVMKGIVSTPTCFSTNNDPDVQRRENHRDYQFRQWDSPEATFVVIFDDNGQVVCRYSASPQVGKADWVTRLRNLLNFR